MRSTHLYIYLASKTVIPAEAGIQKSENTGSPRIKYGAGSVKPGMTVKVKRLMTQYTRGRFKEAKEGIKEFKKKYENPRRGDQSVKKQAWLKAINPLLFILVIFQVTTALLHDVVKGEWFEDLHPAGGVLLAIAAMFHLYLNWNWVRTSYFKKTGP